MITINKQLSSKNNEDGFIIRKAQSRDTFNLAEILYGTDPFIYPAAFKDVATAREQFSKLINLEGSAYHYRNINVAVRQDEEIAGAVCYYNTAIDRSIDYYTCLQLDDEKTKHVCEHYFNHLYSYADALDVFYIVAICVAKKYRGQNIGSMLMNSVVTDKNDKILKLDVLCQNHHAIRLYQKYGFKIEGEKYKGYAYLPDNRPDCYGMIRFPDDRHSVKRFNQNDMEQ